MKSRLRIAVAKLVSLFAVSLIAVADSHIEFASSVDYPLGGSPFNMAEADFDGVNGTDLVASDDDTSTIMFLFNNGNGTFTPGNRVTVPSVESDILAADLDGVNGPDIATSDLAGSVSVLLNNGDGSFLGPVTYPLDSTPRCITGADFDGVDGVDLAVTTTSFSVLEDNLLAILMNNGDGTFSAPVYYPLGYLGPHCLTAADLDGNDGPDIAVSNRDDSSVSVFRNYGDGTFQPPDRWVAPDAPDRVIAADLDGINGPDLATGNFFNTVGVLLNNGNGTFGPAVLYVVPSNAISLAVGDFDRDTDLDIGAVHERTSDMPTDISILANKGDGTFLPFMPVPVGGRTLDIVAADLDGFNGPDIAVTNNTLDSISVLLNATPLVQPVGGSVTGMTLSTIRCDNKTTGQRVRVPLPDDKQWNCEAAGLKAEPGDKIRQIVVGRADGTYNVGGAVTGVDANKVRCYNLDRNRNVFIRLTKGNTTWDCEAAGLRVRTGDRIRQAVQGRAQ